MSEAALLRDLADKLDSLEAVTDFPADIAEPGEITVSWTAGADHAGYPALSEAVGTLLHVEACNVVVGREGPAATERPSAISANVEAALRKVAG